MSAINGIGSNSPVQKIVTHTVQKQVPANAPAQLKQTDKVQLSNVNHLLAALKAGGDFRADKVAAIRAQLDAGTYETGAKLDAAIDRLIDDLGR